MGRTQSSERGQALGRRLVFKREKDGDREMEKQRFRDTRRDEERHGAGAEKERDTEMEKQGQKEDPPHTQPGRGRGRQGEPRRRGSREAARPLLHSDLCLNQELRPGIGGLPLATVPMSPHQAPARGQRSQRGSTEVRGMAALSLSPEGG